MRTDLPTGTVTFLFTDIEGSTRLLHELGDDYADVLAEHRQLLRAAFHRHDGVEVDTQGDAFFVAFARARDAVAAAQDSQAVLAGAPVRVRMGVHTGEPRVVEEGYVGMDVHRAARIASAAHGGQVLLSQATRDLVDADVRDLGAHRLKDLSAPERLYQLGDDSHPPLRTLYQTNLPVPATLFLGRERELGELGELLGRDDVRLLTLTGAGGTGKTRLALQAAAAAAEAYPQGVWWVPLAGIAEPDAVLPAAAAALGGSASLPETVGDRRLLMLLDNLEHLIGVAPALPQLLAACPRLDLLVTSRERLRVAGEHVYEVPPLARSESRELFVARARAALPDFEPDAEVDELCARLDDLPLALELAAARVTVLTPAQLLDRLGSRLDLLKGGRDADARQATLRATIEWSYDLLDEEEQATLAALSVFRGGFTLAAAESVTGADVDVVESLVDKSLVRRWSGDRFGLLELIREFGAARLGDAEEERLLARLMSFLCDLAEQAQLWGEADGASRDELIVPERENIDRALGWALRAGEAELGLRLAWLIEQHWRSRPSDALRWIDALVAAASDDLDPLLRARALRVKGGAFDFTGNDGQALDAYVESLELFRAAGDKIGVAHGLHRVGASTMKTGDVDEGERLIREALALDREAGHRRMEAIAVGLLGGAELRRGALDEAAALFAESAELSQSREFRWWESNMRANVAWVELKRGRLEEAAAALRIAARLQDTIDDPVNLLHSCAMAAAIAAAREGAAAAGALWGALEVLERYAPLPLDWDDERAEYATQLRDVVGAQFDEACAQGRRFTREEALEALDRAMAPSVH